MTSNPISTGRVVALLDTFISDPATREAAKRELLRPDIRDPGTGAPPSDPWASRARPGFLYVMYALLLWSIPVGLIAAVRPDVAAAIGRGMHVYLAGLPEPLYAVFGTGYLGYTAAREWGKARGR